MSFNKEITIYDIAKHLSISATTVSRGLKNHPTINKDTRKKIFETAEELGYRSNLFASSLRSKKTHTLGVIVHKLNSYFIATVLAGMEDIANREGYNLIISHSLESVEKEIANSRTMFNKRVDGLLVALAYDTDNIDHFEPFFKKRIPVIFFDRTYDHPDSIRVEIDNYKSAYNITKHLISNGCKKIMHLGGNMSRNVYADRFRGYKQALQDHKINFDERLLIICKLDEEAGNRAANQIIEMGDARPDGVFSANDTAAVHCMIKLKEAGIQIPADIAFAGFNNDTISKIIEPNLTTINYSGYEMGEAAATCLINCLTGVSNIKTTDTIILRSEMIIRQSSLKKQSL